MERPDLKKLADDLKEQSKPIITEALINGANHISNGMNNAVGDVNQSPKVLLRSISTTLRNGVMLVGQEILANSTDIIKKDRKSSTPAKTPEEEIMNMRELEEEA
ncbi:hypothetical protein SAMN04487944_12131 [Gracilibacillus ureilyticus]|uniref:Uncharacterized protein n=1 Tax=Gracilibacillus ureilyticus TaxID=531814 RepID=A0A1H9V420_9BACI|nr:hypothetical protein [Gracilibacillus ureilyticus]SES16338.1 hypothetical protein SAMN04487944_12131 [Gracilibacillus ureilyticus]